MYSDISKFLFCVRIVYSFGIIALDSTVGRAKKKSICTVKMQTFGFTDTIFIFIGLHG